MIGRCPHQPLRCDICFEPMKTLWDEISRYLSLRVLVLYIRGRTDDALDHRLPELRWKEKIMKITGLQELHLDVITDSTNEQNVAFVKLLRSQMVIGGEQMGTEDFVIGQRQMVCLSKRLWNSLKTTARYPEMEEHYLAGSYGWHGVPEYGTGYIEYVE